MSRVPHDRHAYGQRGAGTLAALRNARLYILEANGDLDRADDVNGDSPSEVAAFLAGEELAEGFTTEEGSTEVTYPLVSDSYGKWAVSWHAPGSYDEFCPDDPHTPIRRWEADKHYPDLWATQLRMSTYDATPGATDHTDAFVAAFAAAKELIEDGAANVDILLDSRQEYVLGEAVQSGANGQYAQIPLPFSNADTGKIRLVGRPRGNDIGYLAAGASGTVIRSTITAPAYDAADGIASMFGGPASYCTGHSASAMYPDEWSFIQLGLQDVTLRQETPTLCGIDAGFISGVTVDGLLQFDTDDLANVNPQTLLPGWGGATPSTGPQAIALICPYSLNWFGTRADTIVVSGWTHGVHLGEWARIKELTCFL
jgi:hypothetical protein